MNGSFLELDGSTDGTTKTREDVLSLCNLKGLPKPSYVIETSRGHFHVIWIYNRPLPWTEKGESYWMSVQKRLIKLFKLNCFLVDEGASLNPVQNLRNPSQLKAYNFKRKCEVVIEKTLNKTSLRAIYMGLNGTNIPKPKKVKASVIFRRFLTKTHFFTMTLAEIANALDISLRTVKREVKKAIKNGDMLQVEKFGNNKGLKRMTKYKSFLCIQAQISEVPTSSIKTNLSDNEQLKRRFNDYGVEEGLRNKTIFATGLFLKCNNDGKINLLELKTALNQGRKKSGISKREFERTLKNVIKSQYTQALSTTKLIQWGLIPPNFHNPHTSTRKVLH